MSQNRTRLSLTRSPICIFDGTVITIKGEVLSNPDRFRVDLVTSLDDTENVALRIDVKFNQQSIVLSSKTDGEKDSSHSAKWCVENDAPFVLSIATGADNYGFKVNDKPLLAEDDESPLLFDHRHPYDDIKRLHLFEPSQDGDDHRPSVQIRHVSIQGGPVVYFNSMYAKFGTLRVIAVDGQQDLVVAMGGALTKHSQFKLILANAEDDTYYLQCHHTSEESYLAVDGDLGKVIAVQNQDSASAFKMEKVNQSSGFQCTAMVTQIEQNALYIGANSDGAVISKSFESGQPPPDSFYFDVIQVGSIWGSGSLGDQSFGFVMRQTSGRKQTPIVFSAGRSVYIQSHYYGSGYLGTVDFLDGQGSQKALSAGAGLGPNAQFDVILPPDSECSSTEFYLKLKTLGERYLAIKDSAVTFVNELTFASLFTMERVNDSDDQVTIAVNGEDNKTTQFIAAQEDGKVYVTNDCSEDTMFTLHILEDPRNLCPPPERSYFLWNKEAGSNLCLHPDSNHRLAVLKLAFGSADTVRAQFQFIKSTTKGTACCKPVYALRSTLFTKFHVDIQDTNDEEKQLVLRYHETLSNPKWNVDWHSEGYYTISSVNYPDCYIGAERIGDEVTAVVLTNDFSSDKVKFQIHVPLNDL